MTPYDFTAIERKWQAHWEANRTFRVSGPGDPGFDPSKPKAYVLDMFPYPSGAGLHLGHPLGYFATDIYSRFKRMSGHNVLHPMGFDAFGLPAEQYAVDTGNHPGPFTDENVITFRDQMKRLGLSFDWEREVRTTDPGYYRWTQWIFLQLFGSWFDPDAGAARPIAELTDRAERDEVRIRPDGSRLAPGDGAFGDEQPWGALTPAERDARLRKLRLAYVDEVPVNWCPALGTVLANEEVTADGRSERGNHPVFKRPLSQWMLRITAYADRLIDDLELVDWPEPVRLMQRNWIGKSHGARVRFPVDGHDATIDVFTTRPDTLFGATYMVLAPEHPLVDRVTDDAHRDAVTRYQSETATRSDVDRQADARVKTGVFTGATATNPATGGSIPIWIADYVLMGYGTGAIMAVPGHDERDFAFAGTFDLEIRAVVDPDDAWLAAHAPADAPADAAARREAYRRDPGAWAEAFTGAGAGIQSENAGVSLNGLPTDEAIAAMIDWLTRSGAGEGEVQYRLRDWLFSRQRYWGEPIPILHDPDGVLVAVDETDLPVTLPDLDDFRPEADQDPDAPPRPALGRAPDGWRIVERDGVRLERELNTMPQWAGSCWYYLRFLDPTNDRVVTDAAAERYWMTPNGVDLYVGGVEHAVLHLLYARFWHKVLHDLGHVSTPEPFGRLMNQGYILAHAYQDERGTYVNADAVTEGPGDSFTYEGRPVTRTLGKMGKSLKNALTPEDVIHQYGSDTLRLYEMYMGPLEQSKPWSTRAIVGVHRFLHRLWRNLIDEETGELRVDDSASPDAKTTRLVHQTIHAVTENLSDLRFNSAIAKLIELNNALVPLEQLPRWVAETLVTLTAPLAPHITEELWERLGHEDSISRVAWPSYDEAQLRSDSIDVVVQVLGRKRGVVNVPADADQDAILAAARAEESIERHIAGKTIRKVIYVPGKLLNVVAN